MLLILDELLHVGRQLKQVELVRTLSEPDVEQLFVPKQLV